MTGICHDGRWYLQVQMQDIVLHSNTCCWGGATVGEGCHATFPPCSLGNLWLATL